VYPCTAPSLLGVQAAPRENVDSSCIDPTELDLFRSYYSSLMYKAILLATQRSFAAMKRRLGSKTATGIFYMERPFFDVDVELKMPNISLNPTLDGIQEAINSTAKAILRASRKLRCWGMLNGPPTYYDLIARDKEVVKSVLLLTGSVEGIKSQVSEYLGTFDTYSFLWKQSLQVCMPGSVCRMR
jgi:dynein heavy chain